MFLGGKNMEELYEDKYGAISIASDFLNDYLSDTKPEYLKVFLFYLWKGIKEHWVISDVANEVDLDEHTVEMALRFWIKKGIFRKECFIKSKNANIPNQSSFQEKKNEEVAKSKKDYTDVKSGLLFGVEKLLGQPMTDRQVDLIEKCYDIYNFDDEMILYLVEYCRDEAKTDARYMSAVAASWFEQKVKNVDEAKELVINTKGLKKSKNSKIISNPNIKIIKGRDGKKRVHNLERGLDSSDNYDKIIINSISNKDFK